MRLADAETLPGVGACVASTHATAPGTTTTGAGQLLGAVVMVVVVAMGTGGNGLMQLLLMATMMVYDGSWQMMTSRLANDDH